MIVLLGTNYSQIIYKVCAKNFGQGQHRLPSEVTEVTDPVSFMVKLQDSHIVH